MFKKGMLSLFAILSLSTNVFATENMTFENNNNLKLNQDIYNIKSKQENIKYYKLNQVNLKNSVKKKQITDMIMAYSTIGSYSGDTNKDKMYSGGLFYSHSFNNYLNSLNIDIRGTKLTYTDTDNKVGIYEGTFIVNGKNPEKRMLGKAGIHVIGETDKYLGGKGEVYILGAGKYNYSTKGYTGFNIDMYVRRLSDTSTFIYQVSPKISFIKYLNTATVEFDHTLDYARSNKNLGPDNHKNHYGYHFKAKYYTTLWNIGAGFFIGNETGLVSNGGYIAGSDGETQTLGLNGELNYNISKTFTAGYKIGYSKYTTINGNAKLLTNTLLLSYKF